MGIKFLYVVCFIIFMLLFNSHVFANEFTKIKIDTTTLEYVSYDIANPSYKLKVSLSHDENTKSLEELMAQENAITGINGVFFCPADYSECNGKNYTINERFVKGQDLSFYDDTGDRAVFGWDSKMRPFIFQTGKINPDSRAEIFEGLGNFPLLLQDGNSTLENYHDIGLYDKKMSTPKERHFICATKDKTHIIFGKSSAITLDNLTPKLAQIGCYDALNLDAGGSSQFIYNGRKLDLYATRNVLDSFVIEHTSIQVSELDAQIEQIMRQISPSLRHVSQERSLPYIEPLIEKIATVRHEIYVANSYDILDANNAIIGYTAEITDIPTLKRVYLLNALERSLKKLRYEIKH